MQPEPCRLLRWSTPGPAEHPEECSNGDARKEVNHTWQERHRRNNATRDPDNRVKTMHGDENGYRPER